MRIPGRHILRGTAALLLVGLAGIACAPDPPAATVPDPPDPRAVNLLYIGNSLTFSNDLPGLLEALVDSAGLGPVAWTNVSVGGYGLQDHWARSRTRNTLAQGGWDLVIIQQGPSATEGRPSLLEYSGYFAAEAESVGADLALYMVWPSLVRFFDFDGVFDSYRTAAENVDGVFFPGGESWRVAWETDPDLELYGLDDFHPSTLGTYLVALVMFEQITGHSPVGLPGSLKTQANITYAIDPDTARLLQEAAMEANRRHARDVPGWPPD